MPDSPAAAAGGDVAGLSYEQARDELIRVVAELEQGSATLEQSLALWERGEALARRCEEWLLGAKKRLDAARAASADEQSAARAASDGGQGAARAASVEGRMSDSRSGRDPQGRPIVAELGRAETPQEFADRKAAASAAHRGNQTILNLVIALAACLAVVAVIVAIVVRPDQAPSQGAVDYVSIAKQAQQSVDTTLVVPHLPSTWSANRAELDAGNADGVTSWQIGLLTPGSQYIGLVQGIDADATWTAQQLDGARQTGTASYGGAQWRVYDRRGASDTGNLAYALVTTVGRSTVVLGGTASDAEFATLATEVGEELK